MAIQKFRGTGVALVTPFQKNGKVDLPALEKLVAHVIKGGIDFLVALGTTGETPTLSAVEKQEVLNAIVTFCDGKVPVMCGIGGNNTDEVLRQLKDMDLRGVDAILSVAPYYNKPSQEGMYRHFRAIQEAVDLPTVLYNVPGRTVADLAHDTVMRLAQVPGIVGIKDATGDIGRGALLVRDAPAHFQIFSGDDATAAGLILLGGRGNISVTANIAPRAMHELCTAALAGDVTRVRQINGQLGTLNKLLFVEGNPVPVKWALAQMGRIPSGIRLPLAELSEQFHAPLRAAMVQAGLL